MPPKALAVNTGYPVQPTAITAAQVARVVGVSHQAVSDREYAGKLEAFIYHGTRMYTMRSVTRWIRERAKRQADQLSARLSASPEVSDAR